MLSSQALERVFPTFDDDRCKCGWGLDSVWPSLLSPKGVAVLDSVEVEHTRPPQAYNPSQSYDGVDPRKEELDLLTRYKIAPYSKRVLEIVELA
jgi:hypothetical protein